MPAHRDWDLKFVAQRGDGCGIACVAILAGVTYYGAKEVMPSSCESEGTYTRDLRSALAKLRVESNELNRFLPDKYLSFDFDAVLRGENQRGWGEARLALGRMGCQAQKNP